MVSADMRKIVLTLAVILACARSVFAVDFAETDVSLAAGLPEATWEREASARIWARSVEEGNFPVNAYCDAETIGRVSARRAEAARLLSARLRSGEEGPASRVLAILLERYASQGITPVTGAEREMISEAEYFRIGGAMATPGLGERGNETPSRLAAMAAAAAPGQGKPHRPEAGGYRGKVSPEAFASGNVNLHLYSLDRAMADYFLLFLYLWEDSPNVKNKIHHPSRPSCRVRPHEEVSKGFFISEFFNKFHHPLSFVFIPFVSICVHSWFQTFRFTYSFSAFSATPRESYSSFLRVCFDYAQHKSVPLWPSFSFRGIT